MAGLAMMYREVLTLRFEDEMKIEEMAQVTWFGINGEAAVAVFARTIASRA